MLGQTFPSFLSYLRPSFLKNVISLHPFSPLWDRCCRYFYTERMRRAFSFGSMYLGSSPFESPGTYSCVFSRPLVVVCQKAQLSNRRERYREGRPGVLKIG